MIHGADLHPSEQAVDVGSARLVPEFAIQRDNPSEPAEEQEDVANPDVLVIEMLLGGTDLAETRAPTRFPGKG